MLATVVVPVYNPGDDIEPCIDSLLAQTLAPDAYEVVFVDDGSTDDTPARLDRLAAEQANVRVIHTPNSGWAGRPRNIGIDAARGEFIQFVDQDDVLAPEALERLTAMAVRNRSDVILPKVASDFRGVALHVYRRNVEAGTLDDTPAIDSLTPHKMLRTTFLREQGIRFPEGRRRLEDQLFMVRAYVRARVISVLADYPCYHYRRRSDGTNAGDALPDPVGYLANVREVLDEIVAHVPPGELRDRLVARFFRIEILGRITEPRTTRRDEPGDAAAGLREQHAYRRAFIEAAVPVARDFATPGVEGHLAPLQRVRLQLLLADAGEQLVTLAERLVPLRAEAVIETARSGRGGIVVAISARIVHADTGDVLELQSVGGRWVLQPSLTDGVLSGPVDVTEALAAARLVVAAREVLTGEEIALRSTSAVEPQPGPAGAGPESTTAALRLTAVARLNPARAAAGAPMSDGSWEIRVRAVAFGLDRSAAATVHEDLPLPPTALLSQGMVVKPSRASDGRFLFDVVGGLSLPEALVQLPVRSSTVGGLTVEVRLRGAVRRRDLPPAPRLVISEGDHVDVRPTSISTRGGHVVIRGRVATHPRLHPRDGRLELRFGDTGGPAIDLGAIRGTRLGPRLPDCAVRVPVHRAVARVLHRAVGRVRAGRRRRAMAGRTAD